ncbi:MAG: LysR family transcriptional regulator [Maricaulaceae bacterium]
MNNWSDYPIFIAVVETGSLTGAGKKLKMSQPTVGRRIRALEDHFKARLLTKENGTLVPTTFGHSILEHALRMQEEASAINRSSATLEHSLAGIIRMSASAGIGTAWLPKVLQIFRRSHPDIMIDMGIGFRNFNLAQREADIALRWQGPGDQNSLIGRKVATATFGLFASPEYISRRGEPKSLEDLKQHDGVVATMLDDELLWIKDENNTPQYLPERITFRTNSIWAFDEAINAGYGIGALPLFGSTMTHTNYVRVLPNVSQQEDLWLVAHEDLRRSSRIRAIFDFLVDAFEKDASFFLNGGHSIFENDQLQCGINADSSDHEHGLAPRIPLEGAQ